MKVKFTLNQIISVKINRSCGLIQDKNFCFSQKRPSQTYQLSLTHT